MMKISNDIKRLLRTWARIIIWSIIMGAIATLLTLWIPGGKEVFTTIGVVVTIILALFVPWVKEVLETELRS